MTKFSIGQKVKIIKNKSGLEEFDKYIGRVGYIGDIYKGRYDIYPKPNEQGEFMCNWKASELELVKPKKAKKEKEGKIGSLVLNLKNGCSENEALMLLKINELVNAFNSTQEEGKK